MNLFIQLSAREDILNQYRYYLDEAAIDAAERFLLAADASIHALVEMPEIGVAKKSKNRHLAGLRIWQVSGFDEFWIYYLVRSDVLQVVRVLHGKRDIGKILKHQPVDSPDID